MNKTIEALARAYQEVVEAACGTYRKDKKEAMDPVDQGELKGSHADRKDKDINNDGKVTGTDKYLHKRRKAVSKAIKNKGETATMNPKMDTEKRGSMEQKESTMSIRDKLMAVLERKDHGNTNQQPHDDQDSPGAKKMRDDNKDPGTYNDLERQSHDDAAKAGRASKVSPKNSTDKDAKGDKSVVNPVKDTTKVGKGTGEVKESVSKQVNSIAASYQSMYKKEEADDQGSEELNSNS